MLDMIHEIEVTFTSGLALYAVSCVLFVTIIGFYQLGLLLRKKIRGDMN